MPKHHEHLPHRNDSTYMTLFMRAYRQNYPDDEIQKARNNARRFQTRYFRREVLTGLAATLFGFLLETWPSSTPEQHKRSWQELRDIRQLLWDSPELYADEAIARARALQGALILQRPKDVIAARVFNYCAEVIRDAGVRGESNAEIAVEEKRVVIVKKLWKYQGDDINCAYALMSHANLIRIKMDRALREEDKASYADDALELIEDACDILRRPYPKEDQTVVYLLLHHALLLKFRLVVFHYKDKDEAQHVLVELKRLAKKINEQIDSPRTIVETLREEAGYLRSLGGDVNLAEEQLDKAKTVFLTIAVRPIPAQLSLARPELEILRMRNDPKFEKKALKYVRLLERHPSAYNLNQLKQLLPQEMYGGQTVQLVVNGPIYTTPLMPYLYYEDFSLRREGLL